MNDYQLLLDKLKQFIQRYYDNQILKGAITLSLLVLSIGLLLIVSEYFLYFPAWFKTSCVIVLTTIFVIVLIRSLLIPMFRKMNVAKGLDEITAAKIIGTHFSDISDKLVNVLELRQQMSANTSISNELLEASIAQKSQSFIHIPFTNAINWKASKRYLPHVAILLITIVLGWLLMPQLFQNSLFRWSKPTQDFSPPAPFDFIILTKNNKVKKLDSYEIKVQLKGNKIPQSLDVEINNQIFTMTALGNNTFELKIPKVQQSLQYRFYGGGFFSDFYQIDLMNQPVVENIDIYVEAPAYTKVKDHHFTTLAPISVPVGSSIRWKMNTAFVDMLQYSLNTTSHSITSRKNKFEWTHKVVNNTNVKIELFNQNESLSANYQQIIQIIQDQMPQLQTELRVNDKSPLVVHFSGKAMDDYGISKIAFEYQIKNAQGKILRTGHRMLSQPNTAIANFEATIDLKAIPVNSGEQLHYFITAWDNDAVHGSKTISSQYWEYKQLAGSELKKFITENTQAIQNSVQQSNQQLQQQQSKQEQFTKSVMTAPMSQWELSQQLEQLSQDKLQLKDQLEAIKAKLDNQKLQTQQQNHSEKTKDLEKSIQDKLNKMMDDKLSKQLADLQKMMSEQRKEKIAEQLEKFAQEQQLMNMDMKQLERLMNQLSEQLAKEQAAKDLNELAKEQEQIVGQKEEQKQQDIQDKFEKITEELKEQLAKDGKENKSENQSIDNAKEAVQEATNAVKSKSNPSESQKKSAEEMRSLAKKMDSDAGGDEEIEEIEINIKDTRQILTNVLKLSFEQEELIKRTKQSSVNAINFKFLARDQANLKRHAKVIADSLDALAVRIPKMNEDILKHKINLAQKLAKSVAYLEDRNVPQASIDQQFAMTYANNIGGLLYELLKNLMMDMQQSMQSSGSGKGKPKPGQGQSGKGKGQQAGEMMQDIISGQQKMGKSPNGQGQGNQQGIKAGQQGQSGQSGANGSGNNNGQSGNNGNQAGNQGMGNAAEIMQQLQQQQNLEKQLDQLIQNLQKEGYSKEVTELLKSIKSDMERQEEQILFNKSSDQMNRQQAKIVQKMMQAQNAIQEQEFSDQRKGETGKHIKNISPPNLLLDMEKRVNLIDQYRAAWPVLDQFYQKISDRYFDKIAH